jgi:hypothetical protein
MLKSRKHQNELKVISTNIYEELSVEDLRKEYLKTKLEL